VIFDLINAVAGLVYIAAFTVGLYFGRRTAPRHHVARVVAAFLVAMVAAFADAAAALLRVDERGWVPVGFAGFFLAGSVVVICLAVGRADRMENAR
jgi:hypothetical protein